MKSGVTEVGLVSLVGKIIGVGVHGCKKSEDYYNQGDAHFKKGENDRAIADFTNAIEMNLRFANAYYYRGWRTFVRANMTRPSQTTPRPLR